MRVSKNYSLLGQNTFAIDAKAARFVEYETTEDLREALTFWKQEFFSKTIPLCKQILFVGKGSNLLFTEDFKGTVFHGNLSDINIVGENSDEVLVSVGAATVWDDFVAWSLNHNLYGAENLSAIPGEVGAAAVQNIGAYGAEVSDLIYSVETICVDNLKDCSFSRQDCKYSYRHSFFKEHFEEYAVHHVVFRLQKRYTPVLKYGALKDFFEKNGNKATAMQVRQFVVETRENKLPSPSVLGNAGSFFMNPIVSSDKLTELLSLYPAIPHYNSEKGTKLSAAWLIDQCGWKGKRIGNVGTYSKQPLVIVNYGGATGEEIVAFAQTLTDEVFRKFGIKLRPEVQFV